MADLTHFDDQGASRMVDVSAKPVSLRQARASGRIRMQPETLTKILDRNLSKGDVLEVARLAGIMAAKKTSDLIPLCHTLSLTGVEVHFAVEGASTLAIEACVRTSGQTGVEMEALTAVSLAALTVYDMCKAIDRDMVIEQVQLEQKSGGRSGLYRRDQDDNRQ